MLCACSGEQFKFEDAPQSPESLATRDFSASGLSSRTGDWEPKLDDVQVDEAESTLKEALSLNYEEARALLGRLEYQRGNLDAALQVFQGIDIKGLTPRMTGAIVERTRQGKPRSKGDVIPSSVMSMHSVSLLLEAILLKAKSLEELGHFRDAAKECNIILEVVEAAFPSGMREGIAKDCKLLEVFHKVLELLPNLWKKAGFLSEAITTYRRVLVKPWNLDPLRIANVQKDLAATLLYGGVETSLPAHLQVWGSATPNGNMEEAILLLLMLMQKVAYGELKWDADIMDHLTFAFTVTGQFELLAGFVEQALPGIYERANRWYLLALCYAAAGRNKVALNLLKKVSGQSEAKHKPHIPASLFGAKLSSQDPKHALYGITFARNVIDLADQPNEHFKGQAHRFLGVCYGNAARVSISDSERALFHKESLASLNSATLNMKEDPELVFNLSLENAVQRNLDVAFDNAMMYSNMVNNDSGRGWRLLALILSADHRFKDAETILEFALDEAGSLDQLELLRVRAVLQIAQEQPKQAIETYRILLSLIQAQREPQSDLENEAKRKIEMAAWQDLATIYTKVGLWRDAEICVNKAKSVELYSPKSWHTSGLLFEAQSLYKEALVSFSIALSIEPDYVPSIVSTAIVLIRLGNQSSLPIARSFLMNALRLEPMNHDAWRNLGLIAKMEGSSEQAVEYFQAACELEMSAPVEAFK
ncbi:A-kinase anchor protein 17A-like isoform X1 [Hibiscus syriacus]|uniref:A-kinase anchor protein 17A-like isoform X1 n=1 Tax=Hibiscus syriacus TaxID=106335 RepID=A0A6A2XXA1_HIBSY|nr:protein NPGR1-like [Hibiscus syriacus]KAE8658964.1 A-kinase anchor protein 17A-like isoform X1 [Hibiscus syriacus]